MKTPQQKATIREYVRYPFLWHVVRENGHYLHIRNWLTGENLVCRK